MAHISSFDRCQIIVFIMLAIIYLSTARDNTSVSWSKFELIKSAGVIDHSIVIKTYTEIDSSLNCALVCNHLGTESFYHLNDSVSCYCNTQADSNIVTDDEGTMVYGYLAKPDNASECQDIYDMGFRTDGEFTTSTGEKIHCNLTNLGWVVFQRRLNGSVDFQRTWDDCVAGFGDASGEFWLGLEELHQMTRSGCQLHVNLEAEPDHPVQDKGFARYSNFSIGAAGTNYALYVDGFSGNVGDSLSFHNGCPFSTYDADNDALPDVNCAKSKIGGWWYSCTITKSCHTSNLNSVYLDGRHSGLKGIRWKYPWGNRYSLLWTEMEFRC